MQVAVRQMTNRTGNEYWREYSHTSSLVPHRPFANFAKLLSAVDVQPQRYSRYLIVNQDTGKLGFVRFGRTRWTFFANGVAPHDRLHFRDASWKVEISFDWGQQLTDRGRNGWIKLALEKGALEKGALDIVGTEIDVDFAFSVSGVQFGEFQIKKAKKTAHPVFRSRLPGIAELGGDGLTRALGRYLSKHLTEPFKFRRNSRGSQAKEFLEVGFPGLMWAQAHRVGDTAIFSLRSFV